MLPGGHLGILSLKYVDKLINFPNNQGVCGVTRLKGLIELSYID